MIQISYKDRELRCEFEEYDYPHGIGISAVFSDTSGPIGTIKFLSDKADESHSMVSGYSYQELVAKLEKALASRKYDELLGNMFLWQSEIEKLGHQKLSPIYGHIAKAF